MVTSVFDKDYDYCKYLNGKLKEKNSKYSFEKSQFPLVVLSNNDDDKKIFESVNIVVENEYFKEYEYICLVPEDRLENIEKFLKRKEKPLISTILYRISDSSYEIEPYPILDLTIEEYKDLCRLFTSTEIVKRIYIDKDYTWILGSYFEK